MYGVRSNNAEASVCWHWYPRKDFTVFDALSETENKTSVCFPTAATSSPSVLSWFSDKDSLVDVSPWGWLAPPGIPDLVDVDGSQVCYPITSHMNNVHWPHSNCAHQVSDPKLKANPLDMFQSQCPTDWNGSTCQHLRTSRWSTLRSLMRQNLGKFLTQHLQGVQQNSWRTSQCEIPLQQSSQCWLHIGNPENFLIKETRNLNQEPPK